MISDKHIVLVTGGSGFLGSRLVSYLSYHGAEVRALYHNTPPSAEQQQLPGVAWQQCDLLDVYDVEQVFDGVSEVYHCAAIVSFNKADRQRLIQANVESTANLVNQALENGIRKMVHVSSIAALGRGDVSNKITEEQQWEESKYNSVYAQSKYYAEMEVWRGMAEGLNGVIVNPAVILGEGNWDKGSASLLKVVYNEFPYYTGGVNGWVDVDDVVRAMYMLMNSDINDERFIVCEGNYSYKELFTMMAEHMGRKPPSRKAGKFLSALVWRFSVLKSMFTGKPSTITKETASTAQRVVYYDNSRLLNMLPGFGYTPMKQTVKRISEAFLKEKQADF
ncbi:MAG: NAD-dependent epimerase/dehydratase family protein [Chitinophagales bacterium]|nr:NAD-dependent epimerase/dehydratase family protein [Chitinophagaceae bacterium]MCB9065283.1 NAD-dependent epimerase/dehydratase family protein [Chitinophagales bacterium]